MASMSADMACRRPHPLHLLPVNTSSDGVHVCGHGMPRTSPTPSPSNVILKLKGCCSIPKASTNSSRRIKAAVMSGAVQAAHLRNKKNGRKKDNKKRTKLINRFITCPQIPSNIYCWTEKELLDNYCLVIDGSASGNRTCLAPEKCKREWKCCSIQLGHLFVPNLPPPNFGLAYHDIACINAPTIGSPPYRLLPRRDTLKATHLLLCQARVNSLCQALDAFEKVQRGSLKRGCPIFGDHKYSCAGKQPGRASAGVRDTYHMSKVDEGHLKTVVSYVRNLEHLFESFVESEVLIMVKEARKLLNYQTLSGGGSVCDIFGAFAFGRNVYLPSHRDKDFTYSIISVHVRDFIYDEADTRIVAYFGFPRLGVAIPLRPGDVLIISPLEPHSISSRCYESDELFCLSAYLKSSIVGLHDNKLELHPAEKILAEEYSTTCRSTLA